jgi:hypothetical protein
MTMYAHLDYLCTAIFDTHAFIKGHEMKESGLNSVTKDLGRALQYACKRRKHGSSSLRRPRKSEAMELSADMGSS